MAPRQDTVATDAGENDDDDSVQVISVDELVYGFESFQAIISPVTITMILSSLAVVYINTPESRAAGEAAISQVYAVTGSASSADSNTQALGQALLNAIVIVSVICAITFLLVLLYKWQCMCLLQGYMVLASAMLLGYLAAAMWNMAIQIYELHVDKITFAVAIYNFGLVGCAAIFYSVGIPLTVTQGYLVLSSVIVAWQLSYFDPWTSWLLLIMLALYDLFAVLSPCGPLKALVKLMQRDDAPAMPGLLYEANVQARRPTRQAPGTNSHSTTRSSTHGQNIINTIEGVNDGPGHAETVRVVTPREESTSAATGNDSEMETIGPTNADSIGDKESGQNMGASNENMELAQVSPGPTTTAITGLCEGDSTVLRTEPDHITSLNSSPSHGVALESGAAVEVLSEYVPLAIARRYRLPTVDDPWPRWMPNIDGSPNDTNFTAEELRSLVQVQFAPGGGHIRVAPVRRLNEEKRYEVYDRDGLLRRVLFVNAQGKIYQDLRGQSDEDPEDDPSRNNIKLGLGDFIFYSVLVAKAALFSFTTFAACSLVILMGLLGTLLLLGVYRKALPALPISIFLGVVFYLLTRYLIQPWIQDIFTGECYV